MIEHKTLPGEIIVELRNLLISIVRKDTRNDTDTLPGGNILWLNADRTLEDYPATFIVPPPKFADCIEYGEYYGELRDGSGFWIDCPLWTKKVIQGAVLKEYSASAAVMVCSNVSRGRR